MTQNDQYMKRMIIHFRYTTGRWIMPALILGLFCSCKNELLNIPANTGTIRFAATSYVVELNNLDSTEILLPLSLPLEEDAVANITIDAQSTASPEEYHITPAIPPAGLQLELPRGATKAAFKVNSLNNFEGQKTLILKLAAATGGLTVANTNAATTITLRGNPILYPELKPSVNELAFGMVDNGTASASQSYLLSGVKLAADVVITASGNYEVSLDDVAFSPSVTVPLGTIETAPVTVYARFAPATGSNQSVRGTLTHSSGTVPDAVINVSGVETGNVIPGVLIAKNDLNYGSGAGALIGLSSGQWVGYSAVGSNPVQYTPTGLSYTGYAGSAVGGALISENRSASSEDISWSFAPQGSGSIYTAQLMNFASAPASADFFSSLGDGNAGSTPAYFNRLYAKASGGNFTVGIGRNSSTAVYAAALLDYGVTYLVVHKYEFITGNSSLYIISGNVPATEPGTASAVSASSGADPAALTRYVVRQSTASPLKVTIGGIRVATSWKEAIGL